ncbi:MAG: hypothetical protein MUO40_01740 [Anaerolineaceae bacterium]|nr:hypothetical protein [Anaerolineaceae bacterium]
MNNSSVCSSSTAWAFDAPGLHSQFIILVWFLVWFYRKTGRIYLGGFVNAMIVTLFAISNTVGADGALL